MQTVKTQLEENGCNLPAEIRELKFYEASKNFLVDAQITNNGNSDT